MKEASYWIENLGLQAYPQGGYFGEVYRSTEGVARDALPQRFSEAHCFGTSIYYLLEHGHISALHRLKSDEIWHFYCGWPLSMHILSPQGYYTQINLGPNFEAGQVFQVLAPAGHWFGATVEGPYSLLGCTVAPGFEISDFELGQRDSLLAQYPNQSEIIKKLTHPA